MATTFTVTTRRCTADTAYIRVAGELCAGSAELICELITTHLEAGRCRIRIDASGAVSVGDAALDRLAAAAREARRDGGVVTMHGVARERLFSSTTAAARTFVLPLSR